MGNLRDVLAKCKRPGEFVPRYKARCKVETESCAWLVDCPNTNGRVFTGTRSGERARVYANMVPNDGEVACNVKHESWTFVCCGYYCD